MSRETLSDATRLFGALGLLKKKCCPQAKWKNTHISEQQHTDLFFRNKKSHIKIDQIEATISKRARYKLGSD